MNSLVRDPGELTNKFNPTLLVQYLSESELGTPSSIFVFWTNIRTPLNDGFFMNRLEEAPKWGNRCQRPFAGGAGNFVFADGHVESHRWVVTAGPDATIRPNVKGRAGGIFAISNLADWNWVKEHTSAPS